MREATVSGRVKNAFDLVADGPAKAQAREACALSIFLGLDSREVEEEQSGGCQKRFFHKAGLVAIFSIHICQPKYALDILKECGILESKPSSTLLVRDTKVLFEDKSLSYASP